MRDNQIDIQELSDITASISHFQQLANHFPQLNTSTELKEFTQALLDKYKVDSWYKLPFENWDSINLHVVSQMWGGGSLGWSGGMSTCAMTNAYTVIIENNKIGFAAIYWHGKLAYLTRMDEKYYDYVAKHNYKMPSQKSAITELTLIHTGTR